MTEKTAPSSPTLPRLTWQAELRAHLQRVQTWADAFVERRSREQKHPVQDFLFTYYSFSPAKLKRWFPPLGITLEWLAEDAAAYPWLLEPPMQFCAATSTVKMDLAALAGRHTRDLAAWISQLCSGIQQRSAHYRCYGLHEWAMVYQQQREQVRHQGHELRLEPAALAAFVQAQNLTCTHYDAFRFFTPPARPLNAFQPTLDSRLEMEQAGCLHVNMDLYKWAAKLWPWCGSTLVGQCFELASAGRELDMRASPYELRHLGYQPICIETPAGRSEYQDSQRALQAAAAPLREQLRLAAAFIAQLH